jgi:hypothetical protein
MLAGISGVPSPAVRGPDPGRAKPSRTAPDLRGPADPSAP